MMTSMSVHHPASAPRLMPRDSRSRVVSHAAVPVSDTVHYNYTVLVVRRAIRYEYRSSIYEYYNYIHETYDL